MLKVTAVLLAFATSAVNTCVPPGTTVTSIGPIVTTGSGGGGTYVSAGKYAGPLHPTIASDSATATKPNLWRAKHLNWATRHMMSPADTVTLMAIADVSTPVRERRQGGGFSDVSSLRELNSRSPDLLRVLLRDRVHATGCSEARRKAISHGPIRPQTQCSATAAGTVHCVS